jgi:hypothetical protein
MKARLNLSIDHQLLNNIKAYAANKGISVSEMVEEYFKTVVRPSKRKNIISMVEKLEQTTIDKKADLKELFYKEQAQKYGF